VNAAPAVADGPHLTAVPDPAAAMFEQALAALKPSKPARKPRARKSTATVIAVAS
jgi:hypothetical protein